MNDTAPPTNSYDELPYQCQAFPQTHPDRMGVVARLFGMEPAPLAKCRVLELGCANGANIIPMALQMPDAKFVGIDLSGKQIAQGRTRIAELGLTNVELMEADLTTAADSLPIFDYIIVHGVYSWVSPPVQDAVLRICSEHLSAQGVAFVSYNTYPGWRMRGTVRDLMGYHARQFKDPKTQVQQARAVLDFVAQSVQGEGSPYGTMLKQEIEVLRGQPDSYLYHEHLEADNLPIYFHEFALRAEARGLQYLGEAEFPTMLASNLPPAVAETLGKIAPDLIRSEQFMDFLRNRPFRQTLLVHRDVALQRRVEWKALTTLQLASPAKPVRTPVDERSGAKVEFRMPSGVSVHVGSPITKAAMTLLALRWPQSMSFTDLQAAARARLGVAPTAAPDPAVVAQDAQTLGAEMLQIAGAGMIELRIKPAPFTLVVRDRPEAYLLARREAAHGDFVTNLRHEG
jgi:2-polyprenyl-3-methyl-5-hydroxy-6-metoxy-1,4-benzoquinol methylase